ncbi:hypothetical protein CAEBREN_10066 [Caenorhabditis brenneri]|uniref:Protein kinase domain-containing protein n=1 Tax=Caenorhabditis brenneri TaxID=135651 RepID=G0N476_CAEBE|nr:hypothetical protein CAEBREN_10066 [Caenorhabditis brenneri]
MIRNLRLTSYGNCRVQHLFAHRRVTTPSATKIICFRMADLQPNNVINGYRILSVIGSGKFGKCYTVQNERRAGATMVMKVLRNIPAEEQAYQRELEVLRSLPQTYKFATFIAEFPIDANYKCIVMTYCGISLHKLRLRNDNGRFSLENTLRIGYQLFDLVHSFHSFGWLHRDIHSGNVTLTTDQFHRPKLGIIDYGLCVPRNGPPSTDVLSMWNKSLYANLGLPFSETDDYVTIVFLLMRCLNLQPLDRGDKPFDRPLFRAAQKAQFHHSPKTFLSREYQWIGKLYTLVESQRYTGIDINAVKTYIRSVNRNFDPSSDITHAVRNGLVIID